MATSAAVVDPVTPTVPSRRHAGQSGRSVMPEWLCSWSRAPASPKTHTNTTTASTRNGTERRAIPPLYAVHTGLVKDRVPASVGAGDERDDADSGAEQDEVEQRQPEARLAALRRHEIRERDIEEPGGRER